MPELNINDILLNQQELDPRTNLPSKVKEEDVTSMVSKAIINRNKNIAQSLSLEAIPMGSFGPDNKLIGQSQYDQGILPEDVSYYNNLEALRSRNQSGWDMFGNALVQSAAEVVGSTIEGLGYLLDLKDIGDLIQGKEDEFGNFISDFGKAIKEKSKDIAPVYIDYEPGSFRPGNFSWWMTNASSVASTLSLAIPGWGAIKALSMVGKGIKALQGMGALSKIVTKGVTRAVLSRHIENMMESSSTFDALYQKNLDKGMGEVEARKNASIAASSIYKRNWAMLLQDIPQYLMMGTKGVVARASLKNTAETAKAMGKSGLGLRAAAVGDKILDMGSEGLEEAYQFGVQKEGEYLAEIALDPSKKNEFGERLGEYFRDGEMWTSAFFGAIGAGAMHVGANVADRAMEAIQTRTSEAQKDVDGKPIARTVKGRRIQDIQSYGAQFSNMYKNVAKAYASGDPQAIRKATDEGKANMFFKAAVNGNMDNLKSFFSDMKEDPTDSILNQWGVTSDIAAEAMEDIPSIIQEAEAFQKAYDENMIKVERGIIKKVNTAAILTRNEYALKKLKEQAQKNRVELDQHLATIHNLDKMSPAGLQLISLKNNANIIDKLIGQIKEDLARPGHSKKEIKGLNNYLDNLYKDQKEIKEASTLLEKEYTQEERKADKELGITDSQFAEASKAQQDQTIIEKNIQDFEQSITELWAQNEKDPKPTAQPKPTTKTDPEVEEEMVKLTGVPLEDDFVSWIDPATNLRHKARVLEIDGEKADVYRIQLYNNDYAPINTPEGFKTVALENLDLDIQMSLAHSHVEPMNVQESIATEATKNELARRSGLASVSQSVSYVDRGDGLLEQLAVRNEEFRKYISDPKHDMTEAVFSFEILFEGDNYVKGFWERHKELKKKIQDKKLTAAEVDTLLQADSEDKLDFLIDELPIHIKVEDKGNTFTAELFYHTTSYDNIVIPLEVYDKLLTTPNAIEEYKLREQLKTREFRQLIGASILLGTPYSIKGADKSEGHPNVRPYDEKNRNRPLKEVFGKENNPIFIGNLDGELDNGTDNDGNEHTVTPGSVYTVTKKTCNGKTALVKLNYSKLSEEHASILYNNIVQRFKKGQGSAATSQDDRVKGLTTGQVIDLLARFGEKATSITHERNAERWADNLQIHAEKQLFVTYDSNGRPQIVFGDPEGDGGTYSIHNTATAAQAEKHFIAWATKHKNYPVYKVHDGLEIKALNRDFKKKFKLGAWSHDGKSTYESFVKNNNIVLSDLQEYIPGVLFEGPVVQMDTDAVVANPKYITNQEVITRTTRKTPAPKQTASTQQRTQPVVTRSELSFDGDRQSYVTSAHALSQTPPGSTIYTTQYLENDSGDMVESLSKVGIVDSEGVISVLSGLKGTRLYSQMVNKHVSDPALYNLLYQAIGSGETQQQIVVQAPIDYVPEIPQVPSQKKQDAAEIVKTLGITIMSEEEAAATETHEVIETEDKVIIEGEEKIEDSFEEKEESEFDKLIKKITKSDWTTADLKEAAWIEIRDQIVDQSVDQKEITIIQKYALVLLEAQKPFDEVIKAVNDKFGLNIKRGSTIFDLEKRLKQEAKAESTSKETKTIEPTNNDNLDVAEEIRYLENRLSSNYSQVEGSSEILKFNDEGEIIDIGGFIKDKQRVNIGTEGATWRGIDFDDADKAARLIQQAKSAGKRIQAIRKKDREHLAILKSTLVTKLNKVVADIGVQETLKKLTADLTYEERGTPNFYPTFLLTGDVNLEAIEKWADKQVSPTKNTVEPKVPIVEENDPEDDDWLPDSPEDDSSTNRLFTKTKNTVTQDLNKELATIRKMLGNKVADNFEIVDKLIEIAGSGRAAWAQYQHDAITLFKHAETGTVYHEAFHRVSLGYLNPIERNKVYSAARILYNKPNASNRQIEEILAERFREYVLTREHTSDIGKVKMFFKRLYNFIKSWFVGPTRITEYEVNKLFESIYNGKFKRNELLQVNKKNLENADYYSMVLYDQDFEKINSGEQLKKVIKGLTRMLFELNNVSEIEHIDKLDWAKVENKLISTVKQYKEQYLGDNPVEKLPENRLATVRRLTELYSNLLGYNPESNKNENFPIIRRLMMAYMKSIGFTSEVTLEAARADELGLVHYDQADHEKSTKDNALGSIKLLVAMSPQSDKKDKDTNFTEFVDYNTAWSTLLNDLWHLDTAKEMITAMENLANDNERFFYHHILNKLKANKGKMLQNQFEVTMRKHKNKFVNMMIERDGKSYSFTEANLQEGSKITKEAWSIALYNSDLMFRPENTTASVNKKAIGPLIKKASTKRDLIKSKKGTPSFAERKASFIQDLVIGFNEIGIDIDENTITQFRVLNNLTEENAIHELSKLLYTVLDTVVKGHQSTKDRQPNNIYLNPKLQPLAEAYAIAHPENTNDMVVGPGGATYYEFSNNSYVTNLNREYNKNGKLATDRMEGRFNGNSIILPQIATSTSKLITSTMAGVFRKGESDAGRDYFTITSVEDYILKMNATMRGMMALPTLADKKTYYFLSGVETLNASDINFDAAGKLVFPQEVIDTFVGYAKDEYDRIQSVKKDLNKLKDLKAKGNKADIKAYEDTLILNYHFTLNKDGSRNYDKANGTKFHLFKGLATSSWNQNIVEERIKIGLNKAVQGELEYAESLDLIYKVPMGTTTGYTTRVLNTPGVKVQFDRFKNRDKAIRAYMAIFALKSMSNNIEILKMYVGDPAFAKAKWGQDERKNEYDIADDLGKRLGAMIGSGEHMVANTEGFGDTLTTSTFNVSTVQTQRLESPFYDDLFTLYSRVYQDSDGNITDAQKSLIHKILKPYKNIDQADGQSYVTPEFYRSIAIRIGEWNTIKENAYTMIISDRVFTPAEEVEMLNVIMQPIKPVYYGQSTELFATDQKTFVPIYDKTSMTPIFRRVVGNNLQMSKILDRMEGVGEFEGLNKIDMLKMDSATKIGNRGMTPIFEDAKTQDILDMNSLADMPVFPQFYTNMRRQLATEPHFEDETKLGTQVIKVGMGNIVMDGVYPNGKTGLDIATELNNSLSRLAREGREYLDVVTGYDGNKINPEKLINLIKKEAETANMPMSVVQAIKYDAVNKEPYLSFDSMPNRTWYHSRLIKLITKNIIDREFAGGQYIQVSSLGFKTNDATLLKEDEAITDIPFIRLNEDGSIRPMGCVVSVSLFKNSIPNYHKKSWDEKVAYIKKHNLDILGYRIPTQGQNSTVVMEITGLLPEQTGNAIILPPEFTALTGSDFDIDKLFLARPIYQGGKNGLVPVPFITGDKFETQYDTMLWYQYKKYKEEFPDSFHEWYYNEQLDLLEEYRELGTEGPLKAAERKAISKEIEALKAKKEGKGAEEKLALSKKIAALHKELRIQNNEIPELNDKLKARVKERATEELIKLKVLKKFDDFKTLSEIERNTPDAIKNLILSNYKAILTSDQHIMHSIAPLGGFGDYLQGLAAQVVKFNGESTSNAMMDLVTPKFQNAAKFKYSTGKQGVPPFALNNTHHVLTQLAKCEMAVRVSDLQVGKGHSVSLHDQVATDGTGILEALSAMIDAHVDLASNPYIVDLNVNPFTYDATSYLIRTGVGKRSFQFLAQPAIKKASELFIYKKGSKIQTEISEDAALDLTQEYYDNKIRSIFNLKKDQEMSEAQKQKISELTDHFEKQVLRSGSTIEQDVIDGMYDVNSLEFQVLQNVVLEKLRTIKAASKPLNSFVQGSQVDTRKYGSDLAEYYVFMNRINEALRVAEEGLITNMYSVISSGIGNLDKHDNSFNVFTRSYLEDGAYHIENLFNGNTIMTTPMFKAITESIMNQLKGVTKDATFVKKLYNEAFSAIIFNKILANEEYFGFTQKAIKTLLYGNPEANSKSIYGLFEEIKSKYPSLTKKNAMFKRLRNIPNTTHPLKQFFSFDKGDFSDAWETEDIISGWEDMLKHESELVRRFAKYLFYYSMYTTGMNNRAQSFWSYVPPTLMKELTSDNKGVISFDAGIKALTKKGNLSTEEYRDIVDQLFKGVSELQKDIKDQSKIQIKHTKEANYLTNVFGHKLFLGLNNKGVRMYTPYVKYDKRIWKYTGYYTNKKGYFTPIYREESKLNYAEGGWNLIEYGLGESLISSNKIIAGKGGFKPTATRGPNKFDVDKFIENMSRAGDFTYVDASDLYFDTINEEIINEEKVEEATVRLPITEQEASNKLSSKEQPIHIFTDGSDTGKQDKSEPIGFGVHAEYNGDSYTISGGRDWSEGMQAKYNKRVSNPTAEMVAVAEALEAFKDTDEHIKIVTDWNGVGQYGRLFDLSNNFTNKAKWVAKESHIKDAYDRIIAAVDAIEANGGSVSIHWVPSHTRQDKAKLEKHKDVFTDAAGNFDEKLYNYLVTNNDIADKIAGDTKSYNTMKGLLDLRVPTVQPKTEVITERVIVKEASRTVPMNFKDGENGRTMRPEFKGKSTMDLVLSGYRTATSRSANPHYKVGDIITYEDRDGRLATVRVTKAPYPVTNISKEEWSKLEGWATSVYDRVAKKLFWQYQFELLDENTQGEIINKICNS